MPHTSQWIRTQSGLLRLRFPEFRDWSGEIRVSGVPDDPREPIVVSVWSDSGSGPPLNVQIEESADGVLWAESARPTRRIDAETTRSTRERPGASEPGSHEPRRE